MSNTPPPPTAPIPPEESETTKTLSFHDIWTLFQKRKRDYLKRFKKRPTGVIVGRLEGAILARNKDQLVKKRMIRMEQIGGKDHLYINNMMIIIGAQETCICPFHHEPDQLAENLYT